MRELYRRATAVLLPGEEDFGIVPVEAQACGRPVVALARGGALETVIDGETGVLVAEPRAEAFADGAAARRGDRRATRRASARTPSSFAARASRPRSQTSSTRPGRAGGHAMVRRHNRLLVAFYVVTDAVLGMLAFVLAYVAALRDRPDSRHRRASRRSSSTSTSCRSSRVHRAARLPAPGPLPAAPRPLARRRLLHRARRQHHRRRPRRRRHAVLPGLLRPATR